MAEDTRPAKATANIPGLRVEEELRLCVERLALREGRTISNYIKRLLRREVRAHANILFQDTRTDYENRE